MLADEVRFVTLDLNDLSLILKIEEYVGIYAWPKHSYEMAFRRGWEIVGIYDKDGLRGVVVYQIVFEQCTLLNLIVSSAALNRGFASLLIGRMLDDASQNGCDSVFLEVRSDNVAAVKLYQKLGFEVVNTRIDYYRYHKQSCDAYEMALHIFG